MKKIFYGLTYLVLITVIFIYLVMTRYDATYGYSVSITSVVGFTGLPVLAVILCLPTVVLNILALILNYKTLTFTKEMITFFASVFSLATGILGIFYFTSSLYISIVIIVASLILFAFSLRNIITMIKEGDQKKQSE